MLEGEMNILFTSLEKERKKERRKERKKERSSIMR